MSDTEAKVVEQQPESTEVEQQEVVEQTQEGTEDVAESKVEETNASAPVEDKINEQVSF